MSQPLTIVVESGETGQPVSGATVVVAGQRLDTGVSGEVRLAPNVPIPTPVDVLAAGFLDRQTFLEARTATARFTLWPRTSPTGLNERFTELIVYTDAVDPPPPEGSSPLTRLRRGAERVFVVPSQGIERDAAALRAHSDYAARITSAGGAVVPYLVTNDPPPGDVVVTAQLDPTDRTCRQDPLVRALTRVRIAGDEITSATVVYCTAEAARSATVGHELGHTFGLNHSPDRSDLMYGFFSSKRTTRYSARESLAMRLMLQRKGGNAFPDNDRSRAGPAAERVRVFVCT